MGLGADATKYLRHNKCSNSSIPVIELINTRPLRLPKRTMKASRMPDENVTISAEHARPKLKELAERRRKENPTTADYSQHPFKCFKPGMGHDSLYKKQRRT